ncbi:MAG: ABC transporter ATP-binding protein [Candidatus Aenigmatarchaeota archaeon]
MDNIIDVRDVTKEYVSGDGKAKVLDGITFSVPRSGKFITIAGSSGSGKTTLLSMIGALDKPTSGQIFIEGTDVTKMGERQLTMLRRKKMGFVFQTFNLLSNLTALENVMLPMEYNHADAGASKSRAENLLKDVKMIHKAAQFPSKLSGGESQRVAIARALANDPDIILADEPTGNLDSATGREIISLLKNLAHEKNKTVIVVTHDEGIMNLSDIKFHIKDGKIAKL